MSNSEFMNTNNNEVLLNITDNFDSKGEDCTTESQQNTNFITNVMENSNLPFIIKETGSQKKFLEIDKNITSASENNSDVPFSAEIFSNGSNENPPTEKKRKEECLTSQACCQHKEDLSGLVTEESRSDNKNYFHNKSSLNDECPSSISHKSNGKSPNVSVLCDANLEVQPNKTQSISSNLNIVPNPNEFNLVGGSSLLVQNPDFLHLNEATNEVLAFSDNSIVISNSNAIPQSDSIVSSNYSLSQLQQYISDDEEDSVAEEVPATPLQYREGDQQMEDSDDDSDSSTSSSTSILISDSSSDSESGDEYENFTTKPICKPIKAKGEMDLNELPPIEDLTISVPEEECIPVGKIYQIVDQLVIVQANKDMPAYDLDTVLFTQGGKPLGKVFDVMGPVTEPYYCIRFNSKDHIKEKDITLNQTVYAAPKTQYSKFVFLTQLMQLKGSDASWENDQEPPEIYLDYSDDEQEQKAKKKFHRNKKVASKTVSDPDEPARKRHSAYVKKMNARNLRLSAARNNQNQNKSKPENGNVLWQPNLPSTIGASPPPPRQFAPCHQMFGRPPLFDARVPLPNSSFPGQDRPQFHRPDFSVYPQVFTGPSTSSRAPGPPPFPRHSGSAGLPPFVRPCDSPVPPPFPRPCASPGPPPFARPCASPGPSNGPGIHPFSPPSYCRLPGNQSLNSTPPTWNSSYPRSDNPWASPFPPPLPRNITPSFRNTYPPNGSFPFSPDIPGSFLNRASPPGGPRFNIPSPWPVQTNTRGNSPQFNFNPSGPPCSQKFFNN